MSCNEIYIITQRFNNNEIEVAFTSKNEMISYVKEKLKGGDSYKYACELTIIKDGRLESYEFPMRVPLCDYNDILDYEKAQE